MLRDEWFNESDLQQSADDLSDLLKDIGTDLFRPVSQVELDSVIAGLHVPQLLTPDCSPIREPDEEMPLDRPHALTGNGYPRSSAVSSTVLTPVGSPVSSCGERSDSPGQTLQQVPEAEASTSRCNVAATPQPEVMDNQVASSPKKLPATRSPIYTQRFMKAVYRHLTDVASSSVEDETLEARNDNAVSTSGRDRSPPIQCPIIQTSRHPSASYVRNSYVQSSSQPVLRSPAYRLNRIGQQLVSGAFYQGPPQGCILQPSYGKPQEYYSIPVSSAPVPVGMIQHLEHPTFPLVQNATGYLPGNRAVYSTLPPVSQHMLYNQPIPIISMSRDQLPEARPPSMPNVIVSDPDSDSEELPPLEDCETPDSFQPAPGMSCAEYLSTLRLSPDGSEPEDPTPNYYIVVEEPQPSINAQLTAQVPFHLQPNQQPETVPYPQGEIAEAVSPSLTLYNQEPTANGEYLQVPNNYAAYPVKEIYRLGAPNSPSASSEGSSPAGGVLKKKPRKVNINYGTDFTCHVCGKQFGKRGSFRQHWKQKHDAPRPFRCERCGKTFLTERDLVVHAENHDPDHKPWQCSECSNRYRYMKDRDRHYDSHHGEPAFRCDHAGCGKAFARRDHLLAHGESHLNRAMREQRKAAAKEQAVKKKRGRKPKGE